MITIELTNEEYHEIMQDWDYWNDESYAIHAAYILREAIERKNKEDDESAYGLMG